MQNVSVMIKPASGACNMRCRYCFYADEMEKRTVPDCGMMSEETLRAVLTKALAHAESSCTIAFQGGEPTLRGLPFFRKAADICNQANGNHVRVSFAIQTNGLLIDEEWCEFLAENRFLVGVSLDGTKDLHDENRLDRRGKSTFNRTVRALALLKKYKVDTNILTVVTGSMARSYRKVYHFYGKNGWSWQQYIPCLDPVAETRGRQPWSLTPERFEHYLKTAFDCWYDDVMSGRRTYHRYFDNLLLIMDGQVPEACGMMGVCGCQYVIEADGSVYPCDFYMLDRYCLGNLNRDSFERIDEKRSEIRFIEESMTVDEKCKGCRWYFLCRGGCRRDRDDGEQGIGRNYYCSAYEHFFAYAWERLKQAYQRVQRASWGHPAVG